MPTFERFSTRTLEERLHIWDEFRGLDLKDAPLLIPQKYAQIANFVDVGLLGSVSKAEAPSKVNAAAITNNPKVYGLHEYFQTDGTKFFLVYTNDGKLWKASYTDGTMTQLILQGLTLAAGVTLDFFTFNNLCIISDGVNAPLYAYRNVIQGAPDVATLSDIYKVGLLVPPSHPSAAEGITGQLPNNTEYYYRTVFVSDTGHVGPPRTGPGAGPFTITAGPSQMDVTLIPVNADAERNVVKRWLYRTLDGTGASEDTLEYYFLDELNDNTTTIYTDNTIDAELGDAILEETGVPPDGLYGFTKHNGLIYAFVKGSHDLRFSNANDVEGWSSFAIEPIDPGDGELITGLGALNRLCIFKERSIHTWEGVPGFFSRTKKATGVGAMAHDTIKNIDLPSGGDVLFFLSQWGPSFFDEQDPYPIARELEPIFTRKDERYQFNHSKGHLAKAEYIYDEKKYFLSIAVNGSDDNNLLLIYDVYAKSWHIREPIYCGSLHTRTDASGQAKVTGGESRDDATYGGHVFTLEGDDSFYDEDFKGEYVTAWSHLGYPNNLKFAKFLEVDLLARATNSILVDVYLDGDQVPAITKTIQQVLSGGVWDETNWDQTTWASTTFKTSIVGLLKRNFRHIALGFRTEGKDEPWQLLQARVRFTVLPPAGDRK